MRRMASYELLLT